MRAFVAIELPAEIKGIIEETQIKLGEAMGSARNAVRWTRPESVHITLQFLGDIPPALVGTISAALTEAGKDVAPISLALGGVGVFPNLTRPRVVWVGLEGEIARLRTLETAIGERLKALGYRPDKPFQPHITVGRVRDNVRPAELTAISQAVARQAALSPVKGPFVARSVSLMESHLQPGGSVYTLLGSGDFCG